MKKDYVRVSVTELLAQEKNKDRCESDIYVFVFHKKAASAEKSIKAQ